MRNCRNFRALIPTFPRFLNLAAALLVFGGIAVSEVEPAEAAVAPQYFKVDRLVVPVIRRRGLEGHVFLVIYLELKDTKYRPEVTEQMPKLRDAYIKSLNRYIAHRPRILYKIRLSELKTLLFRATERVIGEGKLKSVLIQAAANRRF